MKKTNNTFEIFLYHNAIPLITSAIIIALSWASLGGQIALLNQKVDYLVKNQQEYFDRNKEVQIRIGEIQVKMKELETILGRR